MNLSSPAVGRRLFAIAAVAGACLWNVGSLQAGLYECRDSSGAPIYTDSPAPLECLSIPWGRTTYLISATHFRAGFLRCSNERGPGSIRQLFSRRERIVRHPSLHTGHQSTQSLQRPSMPLTRTGPPHALHTSTYRNDHISAVR
jgi:hypothetical protein